jgi:helicase
MREGYDNEKCLKELSEEELAKVLPKILAERIKKRLYAETGKVKDGNLQDNSPTEEGRHKICPYTQDDSRNLKANTLLASSPEIKNCSKPITVLEIDQHRPDRIIFEGKKIGVTSTEFSLIRFLAQHPEQVMSYDELLGELWKDEEDAIYNRVSFHLSKIRRTVLKIIGENNISKEKLKYIFAVVPGRGAMLRLKAKEIKIN